MTELLIHSMSEFAQPIMSCLEATRARSIVQIGVEYKGGIAGLLAKHAGAADGELTSIDPLARPVFRAWANANRHVRHIAKPSLDVIGDLSDVDAWLIGGDHNYYTVSNELATADRLAQRDGKPLLIFVHHVAWPCARRDMYLAPDRIPAEHRHPHSLDGGVTMDSNGILAGRGFRSPGEFAFAREAGGPRNGVLTAVEDFLTTIRADGREVAFALIPAVFGLGVIFTADADWSSAVAQILLPMHDNALLAKLEENRLRNHLAVIEYQDGIRAEHAAMEAVNLAARLGTIDGNAGPDVRAAA